MLHSIFILICGIFHMQILVAARFCEGGHYCSLPRECCTQGCCPPYQSGPRPLPPPSEHVLNLFFISHWFFWCVVVAIILAILCAYALWKKRRTLCGWGYADNHAPSERDSAGSCCAPPQYSRCNSFHHPPPPYTEVTSKPDLYPLVFTCNTDKNDSSYLIVQYFRNYIVRPVGTLSAASTVDSLSSSFMCSINEANTLVPPPYSRATSPEIGFNSPFQQQLTIPRSASELIYASAANGISKSTGAQEISSAVVAQQVYQGLPNRGPHLSLLTQNAAMVGNQNEKGMENALNSSTTYNPASPQSVNENLGFIEDSVVRQHNYTNSRDNDRDSDIGSNRSSGSNVIAGCIPKGFVQSHSDQQFHAANRTECKMSNIFMEDDSVAVSKKFDCGTVLNTLDMINFNDYEKLNSTKESNFSTNCNFNEQNVHALYENCDTRSKPLHRTSTNPTQIVVKPNMLGPTYSSCDSVARVSLTVPRDLDDASQVEIKNLHILKKSIDICCHILKQQQQQKPQETFNGVEHQSTQLNKFNEKYTTDDLPDYIASINCSTISSLTNVCTPSSPPQATSPTGVSEILNQISKDVSYEDVLLSSPTGRTLSMTKLKSVNPQRKTHGKSVTCEFQPTLSVFPSNNSTFSMTTVRLDSSSVDKGTATVTTTTAQNTRGSSKHTDHVLKRPLTLQQSKNKFFTSKPKKALYIPMIPSIMTPPSSRYISKTPVTNVVGSNFFSVKGGRVRKMWVSRSAPSTPASALPPNRLSDNSPLLTEQDEDQENEQNVNIE